jgi:hypothetical protein
MADPDDQPRRQQTADAVSCWMRRPGLTRQVFADLPGTSVSWVGKIRNGDRRPTSAIVTLARALGVPA